MPDISLSPARGEDRTWHYGWVSRFGIGALVTIIFAIAVGVVGLAVAVGGSDVVDAWILAVTAVVAAAFGVFMTFGLISVARTRIALTTGTAGTFLDATIATGHDRLLVPHFRTIRVPVGAIRSVERRREIVRLLGFSTIEDALSVVTAGGERIGLFSSSEMAAVHLPVDEVAGAIAAAAGIVVTDGGTVLTRSDDLYGAASSSWTETPLDAVAARKARLAALRTFQIMFGLMTLTFVLRACG